MSEITISTNNGSAISILHNIRAPEFIERENEKWAQKHPGELRIDLNKEHIIYKYVPVKEAYHQLFDEAVKEYNSLQTAKGHPERIINDYYSHIKSKEGTSKRSKHVMYEMIYTVGSMQNPVPEDEAKAILEEMINGFEKRNPQLFVTCCVGHFDEMGQGHVHLDYIPVAYGCSKGPRVQVSLKQSLKEMGIEGTGWSDTAQMRWIRRENDALETICNKYGYDVIHPLRGTKAEHLSVEEYRLTKMIEEKQELLNEMQELPLGKTIINKARLSQLEAIEQEYEKKLPEIEKAERDLTASKNAFEAYVEKMRILDAERENFEAMVNEEANRKTAGIRAELEQALAFIKSLNLVQKFNEFKETISVKLKFYNKF